MLSWPRCLLLLTLGTAIALAIRYRGSWEGPVRAHARVGLEHAKAVQAQIGMRLKSAEAAVRQQLPVWQRAVEGTLAEERCMSLPYLAFESASSQQAAHCFGSLGFRRMHA